MNGVITIDSSCWLEFLTNGSKAGACEKWIEKATPDNCFCPTIVVFEVYKKMNEKNGVEAADCAVAFVMRRAGIIDLNAKIAIDAANLSLAHKLGAADAIVKATAEAANATLVTLDHHFKGLDNVQVI